MNDSASPESNDFRSSKPRPKGRYGRRSAGIAVVALMAVYSFAQPKLNQRFGWNLPGLRQDGRGQVVVDKSQPKANSTTPRTESGSFDKSSSAPKMLAPKKESPSKKTDVSVERRGPLSGVLKNDKSTAQESSADNRATSKGGSGDLLYGLLRDTGSKRYISPQGLLYTPGSAEGHRLEHLRRHTKDDPGRIGSHGVFDGEMEGALKTIDRAYERAKKNQKTTKKEERGRTIYTVDMGGRVGYVGGRTGQQRRKPMARRVQLVLEGNRVITAYPK